MQDDSVIVTKVTALILEVETDQGDTRQLRFSGAKNCDSDEAGIEMEIGKNGLQHKIKVEFPFEGTIKYEIIAN